MRTINIYGENRNATYSKVREACRGIVLRDGKILMTYAREVDFWMIPGGGREGDETLQDCCIRELEEETGYTVKLTEPYIAIQEYYSHWLYSSYYFVCRITGQKMRHLTEEEDRAGMESRWIPLREAVAIFAAHQDHQNEEIKRGAYLRDYCALKALADEEQL